MGLTKKYERVVVGDLAGGNYTEVTDNGDINLNGTAEINTDGTPIEEATVEYLGSVTKEPTGIPEDEVAKTTLAVDDGTRTFTFGHVSDYSMYVQGKKITKTADESVVFPDTDGKHYFYFDINGVLIHTITFTEDIILKHAFVCEVLWDATNNKSIIFDERHRLMDGQTHLLWHKQFGSSYETGLNVNNVTADGDGNLLEAIQFGVDAGKFNDEDIPFSLTARGITDNYTLLWKEGTAWRWEDTNVIGKTTGTGRLAYNLNTAGVYSLAEVPERDFVNYTVFASNAYNNGTARFLVTMGQQSYGTRIQARAGANDELKNLVLDGLPTAEFIPIATFIMETRDAYTNIRKARVVTTDTGDDYVPWLGSDIAPGTAPSSHLNLTDSDQGDQHTQYKLLKGRSSDIKMITSADSPYSAGSNDETVIIADKASGNIVINFPSCAGQYIDGYVKVVSATPNLNTVTIVLDGTDTIDGDDSDIVITSTNTSMHFKSDGVSNYNVLAANNVEFYRLELGKEIAVDTAPSLYENTGAGMQRSFSATETGGLIWNKNLPDDYNGEDLVVWMGAELWSTPPTTGQAIRFEFTAVLTKADGTSSTYSDPGQVISETMVIDGYTASRTSVFSLSTPITGLQGARAILVKLRRIGGHVEDTYPNTFDLFGVNLIKI